MRKHVAFISIVSGLLVSLLFNNCSAEHTGMTTDGFSVVQDVSFEPCAFTDEMDLFSKTFHNFTKAHCASCHIEGGQGKGTFASSGVLVAYNAFTVVGYTQVSEYAVNSSHNPPYTGPGNASDVNLLNEQWIRGLENITACRGSGGGPDPVQVDIASRAETTSKALNLMTTGQTITLTWNLPTDLSDKNGAFTLPAIPGSQLSITVKRNLLGAKPVYEILSPTLRAGTTDVKISSILVRLNGTIIKNQTTFLYVDNGVRAGETLRLAPGAMVVDGIISPTDTLSLSIGKIEPTVLPPAPVLPRVSFVATASTIPERVNPASIGSQTNFYQVQVRLNAPNDQQYVTATLGVLNTTNAVNRRTTATVVLPGDDRDLAIDRWDWDFSMDTLAVVFAPGETMKTLEVRIANDGRDEANETLRLEIASVVNAIKDTANQQMVVTITDDDGAADPEIPTLTNLMTPGGVLYQSCYRCHNSIDNRGGYNLSDYDLMIANEVLVPFDVASKMYRRMNETIPGLRTMPLNGLLEVNDRRTVESWILNGAKND